jgi:hypothetical protein
VEFVLALAVCLQPLGYPVLEIGLELVGVVVDVDQQTEDGVDKTEIGLSPTQPVTVLLARQRV